MSQWKANFLKSLSLKFKNFWYLNRNSSASTISKGFYFIWHQTPAMHLRKIKKREGGSDQDDSEVGEFKLWSRDLLCSSWRHTHMDIMSTFPSSFDAMNGCV